MFCNKPLVRKKISQKIRVIIRLLSTKCQKQAAWIFVFKVRILEWKEWFGPNNQLPNWTGILVSVNYPNVSALQKNWPGKIL